MSGIIAIVLGFASLILAFTLEGGHLQALGAPTAAMIVFGGTIGAVGLSFPMEVLKNTGKILKVAFSYKAKDPVELIDYFKNLSTKTRKNGILSIEGEISGDTTMDPFMQKGLQMVVDGVEPSTVRSILELQIEAASDRHRSGIGIFEQAGGFAPTMGIIGTVMGLVHVLGDLSDPGTLGGKIAVAFIATLYGVGSANLLWLPLGARLKAIDKSEINERMLMLEAILLIQEGVNPNTLSQKLKGFLDKQQLVKFETLDGKVES